MKQLLQAMLVVVLVGCPRNRPPPDLPPERPATQAESDGPTIRGGVVDGRYADPTRGFSVPVPVGWSWEEGPEDGALQVQLSDPNTRTRVEVWRFSGTDLSVRPRQGCTWTFEDTGPYWGPGGLLDRTVATCVPLDANAPRVFAWMVQGDHAAWQLEGHVPPDAIVHGLDTVRSIVERFVLAE